jgi:hypothetical protein
LLRPRCNDDNTSVQGCCRQAADNCGLAARAPRSTRRKIQVVKTRRLHQHSRRVRYPEKEMCNALRLDKGLDRFLFWEEGVDNEKNDREADAGIGHVEGRPGMSQGEVKIEEKEIDHVLVQQAIGQVS